MCFQYIMHSSSNSRGNVLRVNLDDDLHILKTWYFPIGVLLVSIHPDIHK